MEEKRRFITAVKAYAYLGISKTFFYKIIKEDPTFPKGLNILGKKKVYDINALDKWLYEKNNQTMEIN